MPTATWANLEPRRRARVRSAAMAELGRHGYGGASLNVVAREAGVAKGSLFQYFADKLDLFSDVVEHACHSAYRAMSGYVQDWHDDEAFGDFLARVIVHWADWMGDHPLERGVMLATVTERDPGVRMALREPVDRLYAQGFRPLLERAEARNELPNGSDASLTVLVLVLQHLALAPFEPGLDVGAPLYKVPVAVRDATAARLVRSVITTTAPR